MKSKRDNIHVSSDDSDMESFTRLSQPVTSIDFDSFSFKKGCIYEKTTRLSNHDESHDIHKFNA